MNQIYQITIQGNVPYNGNPVQNTMGGASVGPGGTHSYTSCREIDVVTSSVREAVALASAGLRPTEVITSIYVRQTDVIVDPSCIPRG